MGPASRVWELQGHDRRKEIPNTVQRGIHHLGDGESLGILQADPTKDVP